MEREGCVASTQPAAFLQTAVTPQPHKQPHSCGNLQAASTSQATSYLWKQGGLNLNAPQPQPCQKRALLSIPILIFGRGPSPFQIVTY